MFGIPENFLFGARPRKKIDPESRLFFLRIDNRIPG